MHIVNKRQVMLIEGKLMAEASCLDLKPGEWPDFISVVDDNNEGYLFNKSRQMIHGGMFGGYIYQTVNGGVILEVLND
jgi:hypothetical protein